MRRCRDADDGFLGTKSRSEALKQRLEIRPHRLHCIPVTPQWPAAAALAGGERATSGVQSLALEAAADSAKPRGHSDPRRSKAELDLYDTAGAVELWTINGYLQYST